MKKIYAIFAGICLAIELALIEFAYPLYGQIVICSVFVVFLFYFVLTSEKLIDKDASYRDSEPVYRKGRGRVVYVEPKRSVKPKVKKRKKMRVVEVSEPEPREEPKKRRKEEDEEKESEFLSEWHRMERAAEKL